MLLLSKINILFLYVWHLLITSSLCSCRNSTDLLQRLNLLLVKSSAVLVGDNKIIKEHSRNVASSYLSDKEKIHTQGSNNKKDSRFHSKKPYQLGNFKDFDNSPPQQRSNDDNQFEMVYERVESKSLPYATENNYARNDYHNIRQSRNAFRKDPSYQEKYFEYLRRQTITPVVYRFFPRSQGAKAVAASITAGTGGSIPFILIVPNVDHWKVTGQELASRGYNVVAVGPKQPDDDDDNEEEDDDEDNRDKRADDVNRKQLIRYMEGPALVLQLMDVMRWTKAVVVGCDNESMMAIQAAEALSFHASDKLRTSDSAGNNDRRAVVGLILCGCLEETEAILKSDNYAGMNKEHDFSSNHYPFLDTLDRSFGNISIDQLLERSLPCPFSIVWDGDTTPTSVRKNDEVNTYIENKVNDDNFWSSATHHRSLRELYRHRTLVIGGGTAPHRRRPEYFAWVLSRFVEEKIAPSVAMYENHHRPPLRHQHHDSQRNRDGASTLWNTLHSTGSDSDSSEDHPTSSNSLGYRRLPALPVPWTLPEIFNEESFVVFGRVAATALFYGMALKVLLYQYENLRFGIDMITLFRKTTLGTVRRAVLRTGSILFFSPSVVQSVAGGIDSHINSKSTTSNENSVFNAENDFVPDSTHPVKEQRENGYNDIMNKKENIFKRVKSKYSQFWNKKILRKNRDKSQQLNLENHQKTSILDFTKHDNTSSTQESNTLSIVDDGKNTSTEQENKKKALDHNSNQNNDHQQYQEKDKTNTFKPLFLMDNVVT